MLLVNTNWTFCKVKGNRYIKICFVWLIGNSYHNSSIELDAFETFSIIKPVLPLVSKGFFFPLYCSSE